MFKTICVGRKPGTPEEAVASAFNAAGVRPEHVEAEAIEGEPDAWRWTLAEGAPAILDDEITRFDIQEVRGLLVPINPHHPNIEHGVAADLDSVDWVVIVATDDVDETALVAEARQFAWDLERIGDDGDAD
jgi:hypothetical protein